MGELGLVLIAIFVPLGAAAALRSRHSSWGEAWQHVRMPYLISTMLVLGIIVWVGS